MCEPSILRMAATRLLSSRIVIRAPKSAPRKCSTTQAVHYSQLILFTDCLKSDKRTFNVQIVEQVVVISGRMTPCNADDRYSKTDQLYYLANLKTSFNVHHDCVTIG